jgi:hypothetical protein
MWLVLGLGVLAFSSPSPFSFQELLDICKLYRLRCTYIKFRSLEMAINIHQAKVSWIDIWWNNEAEIWTIQLKDIEGNQVGDAGFTGRNNQAIRDAKNWKTNLNDDNIQIWIEQRTNGKYRLIK